MIIDHITPGPSPTSVTTRVTLEKQSTGPGRVYQVIFSVCDNPCCACENVLCQCLGAREESSGSKPGGPGTAWLEFSLDLGQHHLSRAFGTGGKAGALGHDLVTELTPERWQWLWQFFLTAKRGLMATVDLDTVNVHFPAEVLSGEGSVVGYFEVFPWAEVIGFEHGGSKWVVDDQYCASPGCACTEAALWLFRSPAQPVAEAEGIRSSGVLTLDYESGRFTLRGEYANCPPGQTLLDALRAAEPELEAKLRARHAQIKQLGRRFLHGRAQHGTGPGVAPLNEPAAKPEPARVKGVPARKKTKPRRGKICPCGSGKLFSKCCGAEGKKAKR